MNEQKNPSQDSARERQSSNENSAIKPAGFLRMMAAIFYDGILLFSILFITSIPWIILFERTTGEQLHEHSAYYIFVFWLYSVAFFYFGWFWTKAGQTPGMKAWHIKIATLSDSKMGWLTALKRYAGSLVSWAAVGLGFFWVLISNEKMTWHGHFSGTRLYYHKP